ncbi:hypothetical protein [Mycobacterium sp. OTB74]|jgi:hypothetical protein|nr:hypothetical protein [Mycobacterium sp. OTB74]MDH6246522.1 hypothetical protein [Mycobacterium sp. OTB74]
MTIEIIGGLPEGSLPINVCLGWAAHELFVTTSFDQSSARIAPAGAQA